jgi:dTMP kinase
MVSDENFIVIDGTLDIEKQQNTVRRNVLRTLKLKNQIRGNIARSSQLETNTDE